MRPKSVIAFILKIIVLTLILFGCNVIASSLAGIGSDVTLTDQTEAALAMLLISFLSVVVISYPVVRSKWTGWRLIITVFLLYFGITTFLTQIETVVFLKYLVNVVPAEMIPKLFIQGAITAALFAPLAVLIHGKMRRNVEWVQVNRGYQKTSGGLWILKLVLIGVIYTLIYILFGMFVFKPLAGAAFDQFYAGLQMPQWILPFQVVRGIIWALLAVPVIKMMRGERWETGLAVALLFSILMGALLLAPNEFMPENIRMAHFIEVVSSNFVFGWIVVWLLKPRTLF